MPSLGQWDVPVVKLLRFVQAHLWNGGGLVGGGMFQHEVNICGASTCSDIVWKTEKKYLKILI